MKQHDFISFILETLLEAMRPVSPINEKNIQVDQTLNEMKNHNFKIKIESPELLVKNVNSEDILSTEIVTEKSSEESKENDELEKVNYLIKETEKESETETEKKETEKENNIDNNVEEKKETFINDEFQEMKNRYSEIAVEYQNISKLFQVLQLSIQQLQDNIIDLRKGVDRVAYSEGLKNMANLCQKIYIQQDMELYEELSDILDSFGAQMIQPEAGEQIDLKQHRKKVAGNHNNKIEKCVVPGWQFQDHILVKAIVEV